MMNNRVADEYTGAASPLACWLFPPLQSFFLSDIQGGDFFIFFLNQFHNVVLFVGSCQISCVQQVLVSVFSRWWFLSISHQWARQIPVSSCIGSATEGLSTWTGSHVVGSCMMMLSALRPVKKKMITNTGYYNHSAIRVRLMLLLILRSLPRHIHLKTSFSRKPFGNFTPCASGFYFSITAAAFFLVTHPYHPPYLVAFTLLIEDADGRVSPGSFSTSADGRHTMGMLFWFLTGDSVEFSSIDFRSPGSFDDQTDNRTPQFHIPQPAGSLLLCWCTDHFTSTYYNRVVSIYWDRDLPPLVCFWKSRRRRRSNHSRAPPHSSGQIFQRTSPCNSRFSPDPFPIPRSFQGNRCYFQLPVPSFPNSLWG